MPVNGNADSHGKDKAPLQICPCMSSAKLLAAVLFSDELVMVFLQMLCYKGAPGGAGVPPELSIND
jgi:hypothetical protein